MTRTEIIPVLQSRLSRPRLEHSIRVEETALKLAERYELPVDLVSQAALFHDLCREMEPDLLLKLAGNFGIVIDDIENTEPLLLHGAVAAILIQTEFGIVDSRIIEAVNCHITGAPGISGIARLIFVADFIEPGREFPEAETLRKQVKDLSLNELQLKVYNYTIGYLLKRNYLIHPRTSAGRNELLMKGVTDETWNRYCPF